MNDFINTKRSMTVILVCMSFSPLQGDRSLHRFITVHTEFSVVVVTTPHATSQTAVFNGETFTHRKKCIFTWNLLFSVKFPCFGASCYDYYEKIYLQPNELGQITTTWNIISTIIQLIAVPSGFPSSPGLRTFIKTDYKNSTDPDPRCWRLDWKRYRGGRNIVLIWGITKPFQQNEVPCYACKEFRALKANVIFKVAYSLNIEQGTSFSGRVWWYLKSKLCCGPKVTFPI